MPSSMSLEPLLTCAAVTTVSHWPGSLFTTTSWQTATGGSLTGSSLTGQSRPPLRLKPSMIVKPPQTWPGPIGTEQLVWSTTSRTLLM